jgi:hypothetical protein
MAESSQTYLLGVLVDPRVSGGKHYFSCPCEPCEQEAARQGAIPARCGATGRFAEIEAMLNQNADTTIQGVPLESAHEP